MKTWAKYLPILIGAAIFSGAITWVAGQGIFQDGGVVLASRDVPIESRAFAGIPITHTVTLHFDWDAGCETVTTTERITITGNWVEVEMRHQDGMTLTQSATIPDCEVAYWETPIPSGPCGSDTTLTYSLPLSGNWQERGKAGFIDSEGNTYPVAFAEHYGLVEDGFYLIGVLQLEECPPDPPTPTPYPTSTDYPEQPTYTPLPTYTPRPTLTPTATDTPTETPTATQTPTPTATATEPATPTPTCPPTAVYPIQPTHTPRWTPTPYPTSTPYPTQQAAAGEAIIIPGTVNIVNGSTNYSHVGPGDHLLVSADRSTWLEFRNLHGAAMEPIVITNHGGQVTINDGHWIGIIFHNSQYLHLTGTGDPNVQYGFVLQDQTNCGLFVWDQSEYIEIDHVEVGPIDGAGIRAYSRLTHVPEGWVQHDVTIHNCYVHDTAWEAMYLGNYHTDHPQLDGIHVYNNRLAEIGLEGIQVKNASDVDIHGNHLINIGIRYQQGQGRSAIVLQHDHGSSGAIWGNYIENARRGIEMNGAGPTEIFGNTIIGCGFRPDGGGGIRWFGANNMNIHDNLIMDCNEYGIMVTPTRLGSIHDNVICGTTSGNHIDNDSATESGNVEQQECT